jgi:putative membrane protein
MLKATIGKNDKLARTLILTVSFVVFAAVVLLSRFKLNAGLGFNIHVFAQVNAVINTGVSILLVSGYVAIRNGNQLLHKRIMLSAIFLSVLFLLSYIAHHLMEGETHFGGTGAARYIYFLILITHIILAAVILPFILFAAYRALIAEWPAHKRLARITFPVWLYVAVTGVIVYLMISPYYA